MHLFKIILEAGDLLVVLVSRIVFLLEVGSILNHDNFINVQVLYKDV